MMTRTFIVTMIFWMMAIASLAGCESSFEVFGESDAYFSMFGFLDASADTQWVRVEALQDSLINDANPLDAEFSMTHVASGWRIVWRDSLFEFAGGARAYNIWTTEPILPLETYRLEVVRSDGATSAATVVLPDTFPDPALNTFPFSIINLPIGGEVCATRFELLIVNVDEFAALEVTYRVPNQRGRIRSFEVSYIPEIRFNAQGQVEVDVTWADDLLEFATADIEIDIPELLRLESVEILVAVAGPGWPDNALDDETVALPGTVSNVENGFGFVGGVASKRIDVPIGDFRDASCFE